MPKELTPDFKQVKVEFSFNVQEEDNRMRLDGKVRVDGKALELIKFSDPQIFALWQLIQQGITPYYQAATEICLERGLLMTAPEKKEEGGQAS